MRLLTVLFLLLSFGGAQAQIPISPLEQAIFDQLNQLRKSKKLPPVAFSASLTRVAQAHARDYVEHVYGQVGTECNPHSWSDKGKWTACCYTSDHAKARCLWDKPREITSYPGDGFEISLTVMRDYDLRLGEVKPDRAIEGWFNSPSHRAIMLNEGIFEDAVWKGMGVGVYKGYACVWFGEVADPDTRQAQVSTAK